MSKDKIHTLKESNGNQITYFVVEQRNEVLRRRRWVVYAEFPESGGIRCHETFRWRWAARRELKRIAGDRSWVDVKR